MGTMGHDHHHHHNESGNIGFAFVLNLVFAAIEFAGGVLTNSLAIMADAIHDFGDSVEIEYSDEECRIGDHSCSSPEKACKADPHDHGERR